MVLDSTADSKAEISPISYVRMLKARFPGADYLFISAVTASGREDPDTLRACVQAKIRTRGPGRPGGWRRRGGSAAAAPLPAQPQGSAGIINGTSDHDCPPPGMLRVQCTVTLAPQTRRYARTHARTHAPSRMHAHAPWLRRGSRTHYHCMCRIT